MPEPGEVAREASQRNLHRYQHHQLQMYHATVTQLRRALLLLGLLCSPWVLTRCRRRSSSNSVQREEGKRDASQALVRLFSAPSAATASGHSSPAAGRESSPAGLLPSAGAAQPTAGAVKLQHEGLHQPKPLQRRSRRRRDDLHTGDTEPAGQPGLPDRVLGGPRAAWEGGHSPPTCPQAQKPPLDFSEAKPCQ